MKAGRLRMIKEYFVGHRLAIDYGPYFVPFWMTVLLLLWMSSLISETAAFFIAFLASYIPSALHLLSPAIGQPCRAQPGRQQTVDEAAYFNDQPEVIIVGAGMAGLALAAVLQYRKIPYVVLEQNSEVGVPWESRYARLHLHTTKYTSQLPFIPFPDVYPVYPSKKQVANYLKSYHRMLDLNVAFSTRVDRVEQIKGGSWRVTVSSGEQMTAANLVVALGESSVPRSPQFKGEESFSGKILHSADYTSGRLFTGQKVLVVGAGNTGGELALDLFENAAQPTMLIRARQGLCLMERDIAGIINGAALEMALLLHKIPLSIADRVASLFPVHPRKFGLRARNSNSAVISDLTRCKAPFLDIGTLDLIKRKLVRVVESEIDHLEGSVVHFQDGRSESYEVIIKATGYEHTIPLGLDEKYFSSVDGLPESHIGDRLFFIGYRDLVGRFNAAAVDAFAIADVLESL